MDKDSSKGQNSHLLEWGPGSNNKAEIMALWGALLAAADLQLQNINIYGDSKLVIEWITGNFTMNNPGSVGWRQRTLRLWQMLDCPPITHIYRENNTRAEGLSKRGLCADFGIMYFSRFRNGRVVWNSSVPIP